jgi:hypothetical protein
MSVELTKEQLDALHNAEGTISLIEQEINKAESAGLDVAALRNQLNEVKKVREGLLRVYGGRTTTRRVF